jgi:uncharacterized membrane protein YqiK
VFGFHIAEPNEALLVSGRGQKIEDAAVPAESMTFKVVTGQRVFVWPIVQRVNRLNLDLKKAEVTVGCHTTQGIEVEIHGVVAYKVGPDHASIRNASQRFLADPGGMDQQVTDLFAGHVRAIVGGMTVEDLIRDREALTTAARAATSRDMETMGLVIDTLQIAKVGDPTGYIINLAKPQLSKVSRDARIAEAETNREASEKEAEQNAMVAEAQRESEIKQATAQAQVDKVKAESAQAGPRADAEARKAVVQTETEVAQLQASKTERELESTVRRPADAAAYAAVKTAEGERDAQIMRAEADAEEKRQVGIAGADAEKAQGLVEAEIIRQKGIAEGEALEARAEGLRENQEAVIGQQIAERLPDIVQAAASMFDNVDQITILDGAEGVQRAMNTLLAGAGQALNAARAQFMDGQVDRHEHKEEPTHEAVTDGVRT